MEHLRPEISIIIPVKNGEETIEKCLQAIRANQEKSIEIIVVDDGCTDNSKALAQQYGCRVVRSRGNGGVAAARNTGAHEAHGDILIFLDVDVIIKPHTLSLVRKDLQNEKISALVGVEEIQSTFCNFSSQYKNIWMRYTYLNLPDFIAPFYTSFAVIYRSIFLESGGFDEHYKKPSVEDTVFGQHLTNLGYKIKLARDIEVSHLKHYSLWKHLKTDFERSAALVRNLFRRNIEIAHNLRKTSIPKSFIASVFLFALGLILLLVSALTSTLPMVICSIVCFSLVPIFNIRFLSYLLTYKGGNIFIRSILFLYLDIPIVALGMLYGAVSFYVLKIRY